ncbi:MAG: hypothetical protein CVU56_22500 [Deltaproteobacteria bacterium HGW-Deltaproteobacteria-14]|nr:MAG: hypothetical protein CVU56_22500 [Deltaproteobacteria bacterium HGW-Deltaproteobacteria-14]
MEVLIWPLLVAAALLFVASGLLAARVGRVLAVLAAASGLVAVALAIALGAPPLTLSLPFPLGRLTLGLDPLSAAFLLPVLVVPALGAVYASGYFPADHRAARRTAIAFGLLPAAMIGVVVARDAFALLVAWELMALAAFFAISADDDQPAVRASSWVYLVATHLGTLALIAAFAVLSGHTGTLELAPAAGLPPATTAAVAALFLVGFGVKAGVVPLHLWLPGAHANAPSHVSAVMSGVVLKMGVYGLLRAATLLPDLPQEAGATLLALGALGAVGGAALAAAQSDLKRLLAYSSVDNLAIILMGVGLALYGRAAGHPDLTTLGLAGAVLHVWNHALFKPLMFFVAGSVIHATGTRDLDRLGGAARALPRTARASFAGAISLAGLPPLNGFIGELFIYVGLFRAAQIERWPALAAPALAITGALALLAMVKLHGAVFLGAARDPAHAAHPHEPRAMTAPMTALALACAAAVLAAPLYVPWLAEVVAVLAPGSDTAALTAVPVLTVSLTLAGLAATGLAVALAARRLTRGRSRAAVGTWGCGYAAPTARIQYTASSLSDMATQLLRPFTWPRRAAPELTAALPAPAAFSEATPDPVLDRLVAPAAARAGRVLPRLRSFQHGRVQAYLLYILVALVALLLGV